MAIEGGRLGSTGSASAARQRWVAVLRSYVATVAIGNFVWEVAQLPLYTIWRTGTAGENAFAVVHCTVGDVALASGIFVVALLIAGNRDWPVHNSWRVAILTVLFGIGSTTLLEWLNVVIWKSWAYSSLMPVLPIPGSMLAYHRSCNGLSFRCSRCGALVGIGVPKRANPSVSVGSPPVRAQNHGTQRRWRCRL